MATARHGVRCDGDHPDLQATLYSEMHQQDKERGVRHDDPPRRRRTFGGVDLELLGLAILVEEAKKIEELVDLGLAKAKFVAKVVDVKVFDAAHREVAVALVAGLVPRQIL